MLATEERSAMARDIEEIRRRLLSAHPQVVVQQLQVSHPADDDGLWFFRATSVEVQLESSSGNCPFLVESSHGPLRRVVNSIDEAVAALVEELRLTDPR
jgi:hypothetical protein